MNLARGKSRYVLLVRRNYSPIDFTLLPAAIFEEFIQKKGAAGGSPAAPFF
jgi:hypothetical protein